MGKQIGFSLLGMIVIGFTIVVSFLYFEYVIIPVDFTGGAEAVTRGVFQKAVIGFGGLVATGVLLLTLFTFTRHIGYLTWDFVLECKEYVKEMKMSGHE